MATIIAPARLFSRFSYRNPYPGIFRVVGDMAELMRVKTMMPPGHIRTPSYLRGKTGIVERRLGDPITIRASMRFSHIA